MNNGFQQFLAVASSTLSTVSPELAQHYEKRWLEIASFLAGLTEVQSVDRFVDGYSMQLRDDVMGLLLSQDHEAAARAAADYMEEVYEQASEEHKLAVRREAVRREIPKPTEAVAPSAANNVMAMAA